MKNSKAGGKILVCQHAESPTDPKLAKSTLIREAGAVEIILK